MRQGESPRNTRPDRISDGILVALLAAVFAPSLSYGLVQSWDDGRFLIDFAPVREVSFASLRAIWSGPHFEAYHPLHLMSYWLDVPWTYGAEGPSGPVLHSVSLALWIGAMLILRRAFRELGLAPVPALAAALLVGLHPVQVEAVTWATGRKEVVAMLFSASALWAHLRAESALDRWAWVSRLLLLAAALTKTTTLPLPLAIALLDVGFGRRRARAALVMQLPSLLLAAGLGAGVVALWQSEEMVRPSLPGFARATLVAHTISHHLATALAPFDTSPLYPIHREPESLSPLAWSGPLLLLAAGMALRDAPRTRASLASFVVLLAPVSNLIPLYFEVQDRYLSLPLVALGLGFGLALEGLGARWPRRALLVVLLVLTPLAATTLHVQSAWASEPVLWRRTTERQPRSYFAWMKRGEVARDAGRMDEALASYRAAIDVAPHLRLAHGGLLSALARRDELAHDLRPRSLAFASRYVRALDDANALRALAAELVSAGYRRGTVEPVLRRSLALSPLPPGQLRSAAERQSRDWLAALYRDLAAELTP